MSGVIPGELGMIDQMIDQKLEKLEKLKNDLKWQLSFEEMDWDYFIQVSEQAKKLRQEIEDLRLVIMVGF